MAWRVGVVGASGAVGGTLLQVLAERGFPIAELRLFATEHSAGRRVHWNGQELEIARFSAQALSGLELCFLAVPGAKASRELAPQVLAAGAQVIDKGSAFRMDPDVPLVVPEVNPESVRQGYGLYASPNCTTIPLVMCLGPLSKAAGLRKVVVSTYQAASGAGSGGVRELLEGAAAALERRPAPASVFPRQLAFNVVPQCDRFGVDGYTEEEWKLVRESRKILQQPDLALSATAVRVPVTVGHSETVYLQTERPLAPEEARAILRQAPGVLVRDDPARGEYPTALDVAGTDQAHVGRIRRDPDDPHGLHLWIVGDNLRKGAATNAVQIAELLTRR